MRWTRMSHASLARASIVRSFVGPLARSGLLVFVGLWLAAPASAQDTYPSRVGALESSQLSTRPYALRLPPTDEPWEPIAPPPGTGLDMDGQELREPAVEFPPRPTATQPWAWRKLVRKSSFDGVWMAGGGHDGLGIAEVKASTTVILPAPVFGSPLMISSSFSASFLDRPAGMNIPGELYRVSANIMWMKQYSDRLSFMVGVAPGISSDFEATDGAFRVFGYGMATYQWKPTTQLIFGAAYTGRDDIPVLPMAGLAWTPNNDTRLELTLPRPRLARRIQAPMVRRLSIFGHSPIRHGCCNISNYPTVFLRMTPLDGCLRRSSRKRFRLVFRHGSKHSSSRHLKARRLRRRVHGK